MTTDKKESNYTEWVDEWRQKEKEVQETAEKKPHTLEKAKERAHLDRKGRSYRSNGWYYIKLTKAKKARRALYDVPTGAPAAKAPTYAFVYALKKGRVYNYLSGSYPYKNEAHHLLPVKAFGKKHYKPKQLTLLKKIPYCVNHGENVIFLPKNMKDSPIHNLPQHNGSHGPYNDVVGADASTIAAKMVEKAKDPCDPDDPIQLSALKSLIGFQGNYWNLLKAAGSGITVRKVGEQLLAARAKPSVKKASL